MDVMDTMPMPFNSLRLIDSMWRVHKRLLPHSGPYFENVDMPNGICDEATDVVTFDQTIEDLWFESLTGYFAGLQAAWCKYHVTTLDVKRLCVNIYDAVTMNTHVYLVLRTAAKDNRAWVGMIEAIRLLPQTWLVATQWIEPMMPDRKDEVFEKVREQLVVDRRPWVPTVKEIEAVYKQALKMKEIAHGMV